MTEEEYEKVMITWRKQLQQRCKEKCVTTGNIYNSDQTRIFDQKLPNSLYIEKKQDRDFSGTKSMKDKTYVTVMVCIAEDGRIYPLAIVVQINQPYSFRMITGRKPPLPYTTFKNLWFDRDITYWWITNAFQTHHLNYQGNVNAIITLENCNEHDMKQF